MLKYEDKLQTLFNTVNDWLKFAEAKNFGLLTLNAGIVFGFTQIEQLNNAVKFAGYYLFMPMAVFSFLVALISLFPILTNIERGKFAKTWINSFSNFIDEESHFENIHYYGYLKGINEDEFEAKFLEKTASTDVFSKYEKELAIQILYNSRIAWLKFQLFKIGTFIFGLGVTIAVVSLPIYSLMN